MSHEQKKISIDAKAINVILDKLGSAFAWNETIDGSIFWDIVFNKLCMLKQHGTSDYQPFQPKQLTDEWLIKFVQNHGRRPAVQAKDYESDEWSPVVPLIKVVCDLPFKYIVANGRAYRLCKLAYGEPLE